MCSLCVCVCGAKQGGKRVPLRTQDWVGGGRCSSCDIMRSTKKRLCLWWRERARECECEGSPVCASSVDCSLTWPLFQSQLWRPRERTPLLHTAPPFPSPLPLESASTPCAPPHAQSTVNFPRDGRCFVRGTHSHSPLLACTFMVIVLLVCSEPNVVTPKQGKCNGKNDDKSQGNDLGGLRKNTTECVLCVRGWRGGPSWTDLHPTLLHDMSL